MTPSERRLLDEIEIQRLAAAYSHAVMRLHGPAAASVYAEDGVLTAFYKPAIVGRPAIEAALTATFAPLQFLAQTCGAGVIAVDGDTATATWTVTEFVKRHESDSLDCCFGSYEDDLVRTADGWRFSHRRYLPFYRGPVGTGRAYSAPRFERDLPPWPPAPIS